MNQMVIAFRLSKKDAKLKRWLMLLEKMGEDYDQTTYFKYVLQCHIKKIPCMIGRVNDRSDLSSFSRQASSLTLSTYDGDIYDYMCEIRENPRIKLGSYLKNILSAAINNTQFDNEFIPDIRELDNYDMLHSMNTDYLNQTISNNETVHDDKENSLDEKEVISLNEDKVPDEVHNTIKAVNQTNKLTNNDFFSSEIF